MGLVRFMDNGQFTILIFIQTYGRRDVRVRVILKIFSIKLSMDKTMSMSMKLPTQVNVNP